MSAVNAIVSACPPRVEPGPDRAAACRRSSLLPPLALAKYRVARALESGALRADSILTAIAALLGAIGLASLIVDELFHVPWGDAVGALIIAVIIAREGWSSIQAIRTADPILRRRNRV